MAKGWVASDATTYSLQDRRPDWLSLVSVAIAVDDLKEFDDHYVEIVAGKISDMGINVPYPLIKNEDLNRWGSDWDRKEMRRELVTELLTIPAITTIQITETSLHSRWVTVFSGENDKQKQIRSETFISEYLQPYYNLVSIWEYLRKSDDRPKTHYNVMTDDFSGKISPAWHQVGEMSDELKVIPKGDQTYPLLSTADLVMELVKQEVNDWHEKKIYEFLRSNTPDDSAWVDSDGVNTDEHLEMIAPHKTHNINTTLHYPHPIIAIETGNLQSSTVSSLDFFAHATKFAREQEGCVKFFNESQDRDYLTSDDYLICLDNNASNFEYFETLNDFKAPMLMDQKEAIELFYEEFGAYEDSFI